MELKSIEISIIIVNYNLTESIRNLLNSILLNVKGINYEVIVVDNNSPDRTIENLPSEFPDFNFIFLNTNYGFGHGNNVGFSKSRGEYLLLLNPDTYLIDNLPSQLYKLAKENSDFGIIGPKMIFPDGRFQISTAKFPNLKQEIGHFTGLIGRALLIINLFKNRSFHKKQYYKVDFIFGSCMFVKSSLFKELNGFDEDYFLFTEEVDLCYRTWEKTKYKVVYSFAQKIVHIKSLVTGKNMPERLKLGYESKLKFFKKHYSIYRVFVLKNFIILMSVIKYLTLLLSNSEDNSYKKAYLSIIKHYLKN